MEQMSLKNKLLLFVTIIAVDQFSAWLRRRLTGEQSFQFVQ